MYRSHSYSSYYHWTRIIRMFRSRIRSRASRIRISITILLLIFAWFVALLVFVFVGVVAFVSVFVVVSAFMVVRVMILIRSRGCIVLRIVNCRTCRIRIHRSRNCCGTQWVVDVTLVVVVVS